ncbi:hypothetical protein RAS2_00880 [Phycisphaerae bacterium RAS2]|nr:hypothetical protein RAS2_00880 [Phycisphaerae bacterium RAS2]
MPLSKHICHATLLMLASGTTLFLSGCLINDPNHNEKVRWGLAEEHATNALTESGWELSCTDYELMVFWRRHTPKENGMYVVHDLQLYEYLKKSEKPGPDRFVIAYDKATRKTHLRSDLRSNENLDALPKAPQTKINPD